MIFLWAATTLFTVAVSQEQDIFSCMPQLADRCFSDFFTDFIEGINCSEGEDKCKYDPLQFCGDTKEVLDCAQDIVDEDCLLKDGRNNFDAWNEALSLIHHYMCHQSPDVVEDIIKGMKTNVGCWNPFTFVSCLKDKTTISHVVDLLHVVMDRNECNWVLMGMAACNTVSQKNNDTFCTKVSNNIYEVIHIFMQKSTCGDHFGSSSADITSSLSVILISCFFLRMFAM